MSPITVSVMRLLFVVSTALVFFAGYQFGRDHIEHPDCPSVKAAVVQSIADIKRSVDTSPSGGVLITSSPTAVICEKLPPSTSTASTVEQSEITCPKPLNDRDLWTLHLGRATVPEDIFSNLHHPASPAKYNYFMARQATTWDKTQLQVEEMPCNELYLTRTGSRANQPNKCIAVTPVPDGYASHVQQSHRVGYTALNTDQYQQDYPRSYNSRSNSEPELLRPLLEALPSLIEMMRQTLGDRPHATVMVANAGVLDLLLNFVCSAEAAGIDLASVVVFVGDDAMVQTVKQMGISAIYAPALGAMPTKAAGSYLDGTFSRMMWFKAAAVYVTLMAGYEVLFQDVDLVWLMDPMLYFAQQPQFDLFFMDDGARTPRYTPFFVNSGFYFVKHNPKTIYLFEKLMKAAAAEIGQTHSHQSVLIRHIAESVHLFSLQVYVLDMDLFPSGQAYHENKPFVKKVQARTFRPFVFHMCWTDNRENKLVYFKDIGLWLVSESNPQCFVKNMGSLSAANKDLRSACCQRQKYWPSPTDSDLQATLHTTDEKQKQLKLKREKEHLKDVNFWRQEESRYRQSVKEEEEEEEENVLADDGVADDKLEEDGDLSQKKKHAQKLKQARASLSNPDVMLTEAEKEVEVEEEEVEGYGAGVPLETFDTDNSNKNNMADDEVDDDNDDANDGNNDYDNGEDDADGDDDKYDDDHSVSQPDNKNSNIKNEDAIFL